MVIVKTMMMVIGMLTIVWLICKGIKGILFFMGVAMGFFLSISYKCGESGG